MSRVPARCSSTANGSEPHSPTDAIHKGLGLLTESRREDGLLPFLPVQTNITLVALQKFATAGWIQRRAEAQAADERVKQLEIKTPVAEAASPAVERRQPAEIADGALDAAKPEGAHALRTDPGHRRRLESRNLQADRLDGP